MGNRTRVTSLKTYSTNFEEFGLGKIKIMQRTTTVTITEISSEIEREFNGIHGAHRDREQFLLKKAREFNSIGQLERYHNLFPTGSSQSKRTADFNQ